MLEVKPKTITFKHTMTETLTGEEAATCTITAVHIEPTVRRGSPLPDDVAKAAQALISE